MKMYKFNMTFMNLQFAASLGGCSRDMYFYQWNEQENNFLVEHEDNDDSATKYFLV